jgi:protease-4
MNSWGGSSFSAATMYEALKELSATKPLIVSIQECGTSAAYHAILTAQKIFAYESSMTGSIGCISTIVDASEKLVKEGEKLHVFRSSPLKGDLQYGEKMTPERAEQEQNDVNAIYEIFKGHVLENRKNITNVTKATNGACFLGKEALELGLIDEIGTERDAMKYLQTEYHLENLPVFEIDLL